jgi:DnaJ-class molecular chaperone
VTDPYEILGVAPTATPEEIRKAYRRHAKKLHPDLNPGDRDSEERFKQVAGAHNLLSDPEKRRRFDNGEIDASGVERPQQQYYRDFADRSGPGDPYENASGFADFAQSNDIIAELLRRQAERARRAPGADLHFGLTIDFVDAVNGATKRLTLPGGGSIDVTIPAGVEEGQILRLRGKGAPSRGEGRSGDALVQISINPHRMFERHGADIHLELPVTTLRLKGKGAPQSGGGCGDELVRLKVMVPSEPNPELEAFLSDWDPGPNYDPRRDMQP